MSELLTVKDAGKKLGLSPGSIFALVNRGLIDVERTARGLVLIREEALVGLTLSYDEIADIIRQKKNQLQARRARATGENNGSVTTNSAK